MKGRIESLPLVNERVRCERLQLITEDGRNIGVVLRDEALRRARESGLDLVLIAEQGGEGLPIAKIMDFGKAIYEKKKQQADAKKKQHIIQIKELRFSLKIAEHDFQTKINQALRFLDEGKRVKISLEFRGREAMTIKERGPEFFEKVQKIFDAAGLTKNLMQDKESRLPKMWTRTYFLKK